MKKNILIIGGRSPAALEMARLLHKENNIYVADSMKLGICKYSRLIKEYIQISSPRFKLNNFKTEIIDIIKQYNINLIIPMNEESFYVSIIKNELEKETEVLCDNIQKIKKMHSKYGILDAVQDCPIKVPKTIKVKNKEEFFHHKKSFKSFIAKLEYSRFANNIMHNPNELKFYNDNTWLLQEKIEGDEYCTYTIAERGEILAYSCYKPLYRLKDSASVYFKNTINNQIFNFVKTFISKHNYTGQIGFDIIENETGIYLIECNPRATSGIHLINKNFNFEKTVIANEQTINKRITLPFLFSGITDNNNESKYKNFIKSKDIFSCKKDPFIKYFQILTLFELIYIKTKYKISLKEASTFDIEWNG